MKLYLDPGHGGTDPGATGNGLKEKDLTLTIAKQTEKYLKDNYTGVNIKMSRSSDFTKSLTARTNEANDWGADILLSIHINAFNGSASGYESFIYNGVLNKNTTKLQNAVHAELKKVLKNYSDRGQKKANFHMLREARASATLTESLFIDNKNDAVFLKENSNLQAIGQAHAVGIANFLGLKKKTTSKPAPNNTSKMYKVQVGAFLKKENAEKHAATLKKDGYDTYIVHE